MTLRKKALIIIGVTFACLVVSLYFMSRMVLLRGFSDLEERYVRRDLKRVLGALSDEIVTLDTMVFDWAAWDDTYAFIEDGNAEYIRSNLVDETFTSPRLNLMLFVNSAGQIVFGRAFDLYYAQQARIPHGIEEYLAGDALLLRHLDAESSVTGIVLLPESPMLVASRPILTSEEEGPVRGTLIVGRYLDLAQVERLAETTHLSLALFRLYDPRMPPDFQAARSALLEGTSIFVRPLSNESIAAYALLSDIYGEPALVLRADVPREIYAQGQVTMLYLVSSLLMVGLAFSGVSLLFADKMLLSRLSRLSTVVSSIGASADLSARVAVTGNDELSRLADAINGMLAALERVHGELRESEERYRVLFSNGSDMMFVSEVTSEGMPDRLIEVNDVACRRLGYTREELLNVSLLDLVVPADGKRSPTLAKELLDEEQVLFEAAGVASDGTEILVEVSAHLFNLSGQPAVISIARDIAARKRAEEALRHLVEFENLITTLAIYFINLPPDEIAGGVAHALEAIGELAVVDRGHVFLFSQDGTRIDNAYEWCAPGLEPRMDDWKSLALQSASWWIGKLRWFETIHVSRVGDLPPEAKAEGGPWLPPGAQSLIVTPMVHGGMLIGFLSFSSERVEKAWGEAEINLIKTAAQVLAIAVVQKRAEDALERSRRRFLDVTHTTGDWIWEVDADGRYTYASPVVRQVLGYSPDEVIGRYYYDFFHPDEREELKTRAHDIFRRREPFIQFVNPSRHKDGNMVVLQTTGLPLSDAESNLLGYRGAHRDITAERRLEERLAAVHTLGRELVLSRDQQQIAQATVDAGWFWLQCRLCGLWLVGDEGKALVLQASRGVEQAAGVTTLSLDDGQAVAVAVTRSGEPIYLPDVREAPQYIDVGPGTRSYLCVPLRVGERVIGVLNAESEQPDFFGKDEQQLLSTLADQAALAVENARLYQAVTQQREQLRTLTMRLAEAEEAERQRLARELHDQVGQNLTALGLNLNIVRSQMPREVADAARSRIDDSLVLVEQTTERIRGVMADLRPPVLDDYGLVAALRWYGTRFASRVGVSVTVQGDEHAPRLTAPVENALFRIAQEALTNVAKHAQATQATVAVDIDEEAVRLVVADDGVGFDPAQVGGPGGRRGWGLLGMAERAEAVGGHCRVESRPQQGTRVVVEVTR